MPKAKKTQRSAAAAKAKTSPKRTRLAAQVRQEQMLQAALMEFTAQGYAATGISKIAERAGTSKANVYVHFASKGEIFERLAQKHLSQVDKNPDNLKDAGTSTPSSSGLSIQPMTPRRRTRPPSSAC